MFDRQADLPGLFADARTRLLDVKSDAEARAVFDRLAHRIGDGHVDFKWPAPPREEAQGAPRDLCASLGYDAAKVGKVLGESAAGYRAIKVSDNAGGTEFPSGMVTVAGQRVGILKIGLFSPQGAPALCEAAVAELKIPPPLLATTTAPIRSRRSPQAR